MTPLLMIHTWKPDSENGANDACRDTFLKTWGHMIEHKICYDVTGADVEIKPDEIWFKVPSGYLNTSFKTKLAVEWALEHEYDYFFMVPTDCYIHVPRLLLSGYQRWDYSGYHTYDEHHIGGGSGYWLSRRAMEAVAAFDCYPDYEDRWVGSACQRAGIPAIHDVRYASIEQPYVPESITLHLSKGAGNYKPEQMVALHKQVLAGDIFKV